MTRAVYAKAGSSAYAATVAVFASLLLVSNISATKGVEFVLPGGFTLILDGGFVLFPLAYVLGDVLSEVYGFTATRNAVILGFVVTAIGAVNFYLVIALPAPDWYAGQDAFVATLGLLPRILLASVSGYLIGQLLNAFVLVRMKARTGERLLWARLLGSTVVGELADTVVFCLIAGGVIGLTTPGQYLNYIVVGFLYKTAFEAILMPVTALVIRAYKKRESSYQPALREA